MSNTKNPKLGEEIYDALPTELKTLTDLFEGREKDIVLLSSIGVLSSLLPNYFGLYGGNKVSSNLYLMIIAPPASGKGVMNYSRGLVESIHSEVVAQSKLERDKSVSYTHLRAHETDS